MLVLVLLYSLEAGGFGFIVLQLYHLVDFVRLLPVLVVQPVEVNLHYDTSVPSAGSASLLDRQSLSCP